MKQQNFLGFYSFDDFISSFLRIKDWFINLIFATFAVLTTFITEYMWDTATAVYVLWTLMGVDFITGVWKSFRSKFFVSYKLFRMPLYYVATSFVLAISWWMAKSSMIFGLLPGIVLGGFFSVYFISILENMGELELLPKSFVNVLKSKFGLKVLVEKYFKEEDKKETISSENEEVKKDFTL